MVGGSYLSLVTAHWYGQSVDDKSQSSKLVIFSNIIYLPPPSLPPLPSLHIPSGEG